MAVQSSSKRLVFFFDISALVKMKSASSNPTRDSKGNQSVVGNASGDSSGASEGRNSPRSLHRLATGAREYFVSADQNVGGSAQTSEKWMMFSLEFSDWDVKARMVSMDGVVMPFKATTVSEPAVTPSTGNHGAEGEGIGS